MARSHARDNAQHAALEPESFRALHALLVRELPHYDRALIGYPAMLAFLAARHVTRPNRRPIQRHMLARWRVHHACPILPGALRFLRGRKYPRGKHVRMPPVSTVYAMTAWLLSRVRNGERHLFHIVLPSDGRGRGKRPSDKSRPCPPAAAA